MAMTTTVHGIEITLTPAQEALVRGVPPRGTLVYVWDGDKRPYKPFVTYSEGELLEGRILTIARSYNTVASYAHWEIVPMGLQFSDTIITSEQFTEANHKQLALCWDSSDKAKKVLSVVHSKNKSTFNYDGKSNGVYWSCYQLCTTPYISLPEWTKAMIDACED